MRFNPAFKGLKDKKGTGKNCRMVSLIFYTLRQIKVLWLANKGLWESRGSDGKCVQNLNRKNSRKGTTWGKGACWRVE